MTDSLPNLLPVVVLSVAAFAGALVCGLAGFAFSAVAGAILLHFFPPLEAVPLMMACSIASQGANLVILRKTMQSADWSGFRSQSTCCRTRIRTSSGWASACSWRFTPPTPCCGHNSPIRG